jgi:ATP-dependent Clp endopeptidase proteolytic subunit ClpP
MKFSYRNEKTARFIASYYNKPLDKPEWFKVQNVSEDEAEILVFDYVGWPFVSASEFVSMLSACNQKKLTIRINSPGGDVWDAHAIYNAIKSHPSKPITRIESLAASAASYIAVAGSQRQAYKNTMIMIHEPMSGIFGNQYEAREMADILEQVSNSMIDMYADNTSVGKREIKDMLKAETWMSAKVAKEKGFIDTIIEAGKPIKAEFDLSIFAKLPEEIRPNSSTLLTSSTDLERLLRDQNVPKAFAHKVAAVCRANGLFDQTESDELPQQDNPKDAEIAEFIASLNKNINELGGLNV